MRAHDWTASPLGAPETWAQSLRTTVSLMLASRFPMFVAWGPDLGFLYNDAYALILGDKHPRALGRRFQDIWSEIWADILPFVDTALTGEATWVENLPLTMNRHGFDEETYFTFSYSPAHDDDGQVVGMFCTCAETTGQVLAGRRTVAERERLTQMFEQAPGFMAMLEGPQHVVELANPAFLRLIGRREVLGKTVAEALPDAVEQGYLDLLDGVFRSGEAFSSVGAKYAVQAVPGGPVDERFVDFVYQPITDANNRVTGIFVEGADATERTASEAALRDSEARLRLALQAGRLGSWSLELATWELTASHTCKENFGRFVDESFTYEELREAIHPDDRDRMAASVQQSLSTGEDYDIDYRVVWPNGEVRWVQVRGQPAYAPDGTPLRMAGISLDVTERKLGEEHLHLMVNELNHRVKNSLSTVQAIASQTFRHSDSFEEAKTEFSARLIALAKAHDVLTDANWTGARLAEIVERTIDPHGGRGDERFRFGGPPVLLTPKSALSLSMALHELCTNAAKYGALSSETGRVAITWTLEPGSDGRRLRLRWEESGGPPVTPPTRKGFGSRLIEYGLAAELGGEVRISYEPGGVVCVVDAFLPAA